jgi:hypothetical protein
MTLISDRYYGAMRKETHPVNSTLAALQTGAKLTMELRNDQVEIVQGLVSIARLSQKGRAMWIDKIDTIQEIQVLAMVHRTIEDVEKEYHSRYKRVNREVPIMEIAHSSIF